MAVQTTPANGIELAYEAFGQPPGRSPAGRAHPQGQEG
jgi:hypothetical protein